MTRRPPRRPPTGRPAPLPALALALSVLALAAPLQAQDEPPPYDHDLAVRRTRLVQVVERVGPAVVNIYQQVTTHQRLPWPYSEIYPSTRTSTSLGSGVIIDPDGFLLTNAPVIEPERRRSQHAVEILAGDRTGLRRRAIDVLQAFVPAQDVEGGGVKLHPDERHPFEIDRPILVRRRDQAPPVPAITLGEVCDDGAAFGEREVAVLQCGNLAARIDRPILRALHRRRARLNGLGLVIEAKEVQGPMGAERAAGAHAPKHAANV